MRKVLLLEPNYKNKYPPIGLMKLATYHRMLGDHVVFFKGDLKSFVIEQLTEKAIVKISNNCSKNLRKLYQYVYNYIYKGHTADLDYILERVEQTALVQANLKVYREIYNKKKYLENPEWDRVCVSTLFTFHWGITVQTIKFAKQLCKTVTEVKVGGVTASLMPEEIKKETGIEPLCGLLDKPGVLDDNNIIIDTLPLDYSILEEIDYKYPASNAYYGYTTRGCIRHCDFCAVPTLEPRFKNFIPIATSVIKTNERFGEQKDLLLLDNNVLASKKFPEIVNEIKLLGFTNTSKYIEPDQYDICIRNLEDGYNDKAYIKMAYRLIQALLDKVKFGEQLELYSLLDEYDMLNINTITKEAILSTKEIIHPLYIRYNKRMPRERYVDFNQGIDARLISEDNAKLLSEIPIRPVRLAYDKFSDTPDYDKAVRLLASYGIKHFSNYMLYNEIDSPSELYKRLRLNIELADELNILIYSFPMKYHPILGDYSKNRDYIGEHWNRKFIRAIQVILNATKGKVGIGLNFFEKAFGKNEEEFFKILYMPEVYILYRYYFEENGATERWWNEFNSLENPELEEVKSIIHSNHFDVISENTKINLLLRHYQINRDTLEKDHHFTQTYSKKMILT